MKSNIVITTGPGNNSGGGGGGGDWTEVYTQTVQNDSGSTASGQRIMVPLWFIEGEVPAGQEIEIRKSDGTTALTYQQIVNVCHNHPDGSMNHAVAVFIQEDNVAGSATATFKVGKTANSVASDTSAITDQNIKDLNYTVDVVSAGTTYTFDIDDAFAAGDIYETCTGAAQREVLAFGLAKNAGTPNQAILCLAWVGLLRDGTTSYIWARPISNWNENYSSEAAAGTGSITAVRTKKNGSTVKEYTHAGYNMAGGVGVDICETTYVPSWTTNAPTLRPLIDPSRLALSHATPGYPHSAGLITAIGSVTPATYTPFSILDLTANLNTTGGRPEIGWQDSHAGVQAIVTQRADWLQHAKAYATATTPICKNYYSSAYGRPLVLRGKTYGSIVGNGGVSSFTLTLSAGTSPFNVSGGVGANVYHWPATTFAAYALTGESWFRENVMVDAIYTLFATAEATRAKTWPNTDAQSSMIRYDGGPRGLAWGLRNVSNGRWVCADSDPLHDYLDDVHADTIAFLNSASKTDNMNDNFEALGWLVDLEDGGAESGGHWVRWYMGGYLSTATGMDAVRGAFNISTDAFVTMFMRKCAFGSGVDGCMKNITAYTMNFTHQNGNGGAAGDMAQTWANVGLGDPYATWNSTTQFIPGGSCPGSGLGDVYLGGADYALIWHSAICLWTDAGMTGVSSYLTYLETEETADAPTNAEWAARMNWYIREAA